MDSREEGTDETANGMFRVVQDTFDLTAQYLQ